MSMNLNTYGSMFQISDKTGLHTLVMKKDFLVLPNPTRKTKTLLWLLMSPLIFYMPLIDKTGTRSSYLVVLSIFLIKETSNG